jgi:NADPH-dependent ferric siderophore reductase
MTTRVRVTKYAHELRAGDQFECMGIRGQVAMICNGLNIARIWLTTGEVATVPAIAAARVELISVGVTL